MEWISFENLIVTQLVKNSPVFMEHSSHEAAVGPYPEAD
jgi:hypothetical protein